MYASLIGEVDGVRLLDAATLQRATTEQSNGPDRVLMIPSRFALGFWLSTAISPMSGEGSFGHGGAGGSLGFADPAREIAFGYVMNAMTASLTGDARTLALVDACLRSL
jgi:CubicO group peptidase (beta-lactamase class C family)